MVVPSDRKTFRIDSRTEGSHQRIVLSGVIDENADLKPLAQMGTSVEVNLRDVRRINSFGVRAWIDAIRQVPKDVRLVFVECPPPVIDQCNMVKGFLGHGVLKSFYAPMTCEECDEQRSQLFDTEQCRELGGKLPRTPCPRCGRDMEVDDLEEQYLLFVRESPR
jgi:ABC-type transporter Mla MlaB component